MILRKRRLSRWPRFELNFVKSNQSGHINEACHLNKINMVSVLWFRTREGRHEGRWYKKGVGGDERKDNEFLPVGAINRLNVNFLKLVTKHLEWVFGGAVAREGWQGKEGDCSVTQEDLQEDQHLWDEVQHRVGRRDRWSCPVPK